MSTNPEIRARERIEELRKFLAKTISKLGDLNSLFEFECRENEWNDETYLTIGDALAKLGLALADLTLWYEGDEQ